MVNTNMNSPIIYGEVNCAMKDAIKLLKKEFLSDKDKSIIKGALVNASFLYKDAVKYEMYGFMSNYSELDRLWRTRKDV